MTTAEAIKYFENWKLCLASINLPGLEACNKALEALHFMQGLEEMKPLVIDAKASADLNQMLQEIKHRMPTICTVEPEIVRCKDCKHFTEGMAIGMCKRINDKPILPVPYNHFCSYGERREDDGH